MINIFRELKHQQLVERKRIDEKRGNISALEHSLKRANVNTTKQQKETKAAAESAAEFRRQVIILEI